MLSGNCLTGVMMMSSDINVQALKNLEAPQLIQVQRNDSEKTNSNTSSIKTKTEPLATIETIKEEVAQAVENLNAKAQDIRRELNFTVDSDTGTTVVTVMNFDTKEVIRQIPSEEFLKFAKQMEEFLGEKGALFTADV